jgi:hypothetical protein
MSLNNIQRLVFLTEKGCVRCEIGTAFCTTYFMLLRWISGIKALNGVNYVSYSAAPHICSFLNRETESVPATYNRQCVVHMEADAHKPSKHSLPLLQRQMLDRQDVGVLNEMSWAQQSLFLSFFSHFVQTDNTKQYKTTWNQTGRR